MSKSRLNVFGLNMDIERNVIVSEMPIGWHLVFSHLGAIMIGSFSTKSHMISKEALPEPIIIPALKVVKLISPSLSSTSTFFLESKLWQIWFIDNPTQIDNVIYVYLLKCISKIYSRLFFKDFIVNRCWHRMKQIISTINIFGDDLQRVLF